jgi:hypothetical protein
MLDAIFSVAVSHDRHCQKLEDALYRAVALRGSTKRTATVDSHEMEDLIGDLRWATVDLCAAIAEAAVRRVLGTRPLDRRISDTGLIEELHPADLEQFMRPIFEESGIGDRFEVRSAAQVYRD